MGAGETHAMMMQRWWSTLRAEQRLAHCERHRPIPIEWATHVASALFRDPELPSSSDWEPPVDRLVELGWIDADAWRAFRDSEL